MPHRSNIHQTTATLLEIADSVSSAGPRRPSARGSLWCALACVAGICGCVPATVSVVPAHLRTRAESSEYAETSSHADVLAMLAALQADSAPIDVQYIGKTAAGKPIPLVIASDPPVSSAIQARRQGKLVVYVQANIHAGEVEGKEAVLMLLRKLRQGAYKHWLGKFVLLVTPIYNGDGNDQLADGARIRPSQDGPNRVGQRASGEGLDLNRDCIKAVAIETRAVLRHVYNAWDPDVVMDLHTTNGTRHGYLLTYSPPLNPNTDEGIMAFTRDELLPSVRRRIRRESGIELFDYGNVERRRDGPVWETFGEEGRYVTNYAGLRNRIAVLSEAASFQPFKTRIDVTLRFVEAVLDKVAKRAAHIGQLTRAADERLARWGRDARMAPPRGVRFALASRGIERVILEKTQPDEVVDHRKAPTSLEAVLMPVFDRFATTRTSRWPTAYFLQPDQKTAVDLLRRHGIIVDELTAPWTGMTEQFSIDEMVASLNPFGGGRLLRLEGRFNPVPATYSAGTHVVRTSQPFGQLAFYLLEAESLDGLAAWGAVSGDLTPGSVFPISKTMEPINAPTIRTSTSNR